MPKYNTGPISHYDEPQARQMNFTQDSIEALHRRVLSGHMVILEAVAWAGGTQSDAAGDSKFALSENHGSLTRECQLHMCASLDRAQAHSSNVFRIIKKIYDSTSRATRP